MPSVGKGPPVHAAFCGARDYPASCAPKAGLRTYGSNQRLEFQGMMKPVVWWKLA